MGGDGVWEEDVILVHVLVGGGLLSNLTPITGQPAMELKLKPSFVLTRSKRKVRVCLRSQRGDGDGLKQR